MNPDPRQADDEVWRNRFFAVNFVRIGGTVVVLFGLFVWHSDWLRSGGAVEIGLPLALIGLAASFWGPLALARKWRTPPGQ